MIFEYGCFACNATFEVDRPMSEYNKKTKCKCGASAHRLLSAVGKPITHAHGRIGPNGNWCYSIDPKPVWIKNQAHFREACRARNLDPVGLD